jgi:hypothetical protein
LQGSPVSATGVAHSARLPCFTIDGILSHWRSGLADSYSVWLVHHHKSFRFNTNHRMFPDYCIPHSPSILTDEMASFGSGRDIMIPDLAAEHLAGHGINPGDCIDLEQSRPATVGMEIDV